MESRRLQYSEDALAEMGEGAPNQALSREAVHSMTLGELKEALKARGLSVNGTRELLRKRLLPTDKCMTT